MHSFRRTQSPIRYSSIGLVVLAILFMGIASCSSSHKPSRRSETHLDPGWPKSDDFFHEASLGRVQVPLAVIPDSELVEDDELCLNCHQVYAESMAHNVHRGNTCEDCHGPAMVHLQTRGEPGTIINPRLLTGPQKSEICLQCHEEEQCTPGAQYRYSKHAHAGVGCTDCHNAHYNVPPGTPPTSLEDEEASRRSRTQTQPAGLVRGQDEDALPSLLGTSNFLGAVAPDICYKCHADKEEYQYIAGPHQICGPNGFNCTTCHDPHGKIREESRKDLCLECHQDGSPTMAYHSSTHELYGVACTDCHNPHPNTNVQRMVNISHTSVKRPKRLPMSVQEPEACYKCHPAIYGKNALPSHHPIKEGKMVCSDCHDGHGQFEGNLIADRVNDVCWKCHAEKQGPFVYEHPPVTENCAICHEPHGTVADNLLRQPTTFLCLRCHTGHLRRHGGTDLDGSQVNQEAFYSDCTICHKQIHGSDLPGPVRQHDFMR